MANFNFQSTIFVVISVNRDLDFFFLFFLRFVTRNNPPLFFKSFRLWKRCSKCIPLNCHYHQIGFTLKQVVPVSYYHRHNRLTKHLNLKLQTYLPIPKFDKSKYSTVCNGPFALDLISCKYRINTLDII